MEPSGRNRRQPVANGTTEKLKRAKTVAVGCDRLRRGAHAKERVDGSSPSERSDSLIPASTRCLESAEWTHGSNG
jgi:hypothetical protein